MLNHLMTLMSLGVNHTIHVAGEVGFRELVKFESMDDIGQ